MSPRRHPERWLVIPNWETFQHYGDRRPAWVKNYVAQLDSEDYLELSSHLRAVLHDLRLLYAKRKKVVPANPYRLSVLLGISVSQNNLDALCNAGLLQITASRPASQSASTDARHSTRSLRSKKKEPPKPPADAGGFEDIYFEARSPANGRITPERLRALGLRPRDLRRYTGCRETRGSHGRGYARDVLGTDRPPSDWPHPRPEPEEVLATLEAHAEAEAPSGV